MAPEQYICETLKHSSDENEIVFSARKIVAPSDTHNYLNDIIETLGEDRKVGLDNIIKEFKKNEEVWNLYIKDIKDWFEEKKKKLDL